MKPNEETPVETPVETTPTKIPVNDTTVSTEPSPTVAPSTPTEPVSTATPPEPTPIVAALAEPPAQSTEQPYPFKKPRKTRLFVLLTIAILLIAGAAVGYVMWNDLQSTNSAQDNAQESTAADGTQEAIQPLEDTEESISAEATDIEQDLNSIDDSQYADSTLSDGTIYTKE